MLFEEERIVTLLTPGAVGRRLGLSSSRVIQLDREGVLPAMRDSAGRRLYHADAVEGFAKWREQRRELLRQEIGTAQEGR
jgi:DNA-binding transcriptional MerR regulator